MVMQKSTNHQSGSSTAESKKGHCDIIGMKSKINRSRSMDLPLEHDNCGQGDLKSNPQKREMGDNYSAVTTTVKQDTGVQRRKKQRNTLISTTEFNRLVQKPAVKWSTLSPGSIYKLVWVYGGSKGKVIANLEDWTGTIISTLLPRFILNRLLQTSTEPGTTTFLRPIGGEEVDIAVAKKHVCKNCKKELSSRNYLNRHVKKCEEKDSNIL